MISLHVPLRAGRIACGALTLLAASLALQSCGSTSSGPDTVNAQLTIVLLGTGSGSVTSSTPGNTSPVYTSTFGSMSCGGGFNVCTASHDLDANGTLVVNLTPIAASNSDFKGWSGDCTAANVGGFGQVFVNTETNYECRATFDLKPNGQATVTVGVTGSGRVTSSAPAGSGYETTLGAINCSGAGAGCAASGGYTTPVAIKLMAEPGVGAQFTGWSAGCPAAGGIATTEITVNAATAYTCTATFGAIAPAIASAEFAWMSNRTGNYEIFRMRMDGGGLLNLTNSPTNDVEPDWSPDGASIVFTSERDGNGEIYRMTGTGTGVTNLTNNPGETDNLASWSPNGTQIAYTVSSSGGSLWKMATNGTGKVSVVLGVGYVDSDPDWSRDGLRLAFETNRTILPVEGNQYDVWAVDATGTGEVVLTNAVPGTDQDPSWSPTRDEILFTTTRHGVTNAEIYLMNADGTNLRRMTDHPGTDASASWSPDGEWIIFTSNRTGNFEIHVMRRDGTGLMRVTNDAGTDNWPSWKP